MVNLGFTQKEGEMLAEFMVNKPAPYVLLEAGERMHMEIPQWVAAGRPFVLSVVARVENYTGVLDTGYGKMYLLDTETGEVAQALNHIATLNVAVFLDKKYYGSNHWIFIAKERLRANLHADNDADKTGVATD